MKYYYKNASSLWNEINKSFKEINDQINEVFDYEGQGHQM